MNTLIRLFLAAAFAAAPLAAPQAVLAQGQNGTTLTSENTASGEWLRTYGWSIAKTVQPPSWSLYGGDTGTSQYTVSVVRDQGLDSAALLGQVCVTNGGEVATEGLAIFEDASLPPSKTPIASAPVDLSAKPVLLPGETHCYQYRVPLPAPPSAGATYKATARITITNHSGSLGQASGPSPSATTVFPVAPQEVNPSVTVNDSNGSSFQFSGTGSQSYPATFACPADSGYRPNTATIAQTGQSAMAGVTVTCATLDVRKDAQTSLKRTYNWTVSKAADKPYLTLALGQQFPVNYTVTLAGGHTDSDWKVRGKVYVSAPLKADIKSAVDEISGGIFAPLDFGATPAPLALPQGGSLVLPYSSPLPDGSQRTNTARVELQNYAYAADGSASPLGTTVAQAQAPVWFFNAEVAEADKCADVTDTMTGTLGRVCRGVDPMPKTFSYSVNAGPYPQCGTYRINNVVNALGSDTGASASAAAAVTVNVPCQTGCTLTIGYWKNHAGFGPQQDMLSRRLPVTLGLPGGQKSVNVTMPQQAVQLLGMDLGSPSNGVIKLYAQLLAAKLNIAAGASQQPVAQALTQADNLLAGTNQDDWQGMARVQKEIVLALAGTFDNYNNGLLGVQHCSQ